MSLQATSVPSQDPAGASAPAQFGYWEGSALLHKAWLYGDHMYTLIYLTVVNMSVFITS